MDQTERRRASRARCLYGGRIAYGKGYLSLDCSVRNLSQDGALVSFPNGGTIPEHFQLIVPQLGGPVSARIVWRDGTRYGIVFEQAPGEASKPKASPLALAERLRGYAGTPVSAS